MNYPPPRLIFWETTAGCNLRCIHCRRVTLADQLTPQDLTTEESFQLIDQIAEVGKPVFVLSGGEPLFRPDIYDIARYATNAGLPVALATNGTRIDDAVAEHIKASGVKRVSISFDGADAATHDAFRGLPGSFDDAVAGFQALRRVGLPVQINTTVANHNKIQLESMLQMARDLDAVGLHLFLLVPVGCGVEIAEEQMINAQEYERVLNWLYDTEQQQPDLQLKATCAPHYFRVMRTRRAEERRSGILRDLPASHDRQVHGHPHGQMHAATKGCLAGTGVCFVSHRGEVFPCGYLPVEAGNVRQQAFGDIWQNSPLFAELRDPDQLEGKCGVCQFKSLCSGCRARAYGITGNYLAEEPLCAYQPETREVVLN
ncbi:MAG: radical SAM/SPASM domain-containing protein [Anaerolineaceae bacterium]|nr:radical SAM/SPASM domain-containing protein [Anaerolineaceae bacterium]